MKTLRFAPIIRVSTEEQEKKGESLNTQTSQIIGYVDYLKGVIPEYCWRYKGQEHATPNQERAILDQLLSDADKDIFDAVIVVNLDRWSRDNKKSKEGLEIFRNNGIKFYVGSTEYDLFNNTQNLFIGLHTEFAEYQAKEQATRSIINRIARARRNIPSGGRIPWGRTFDKKTEKWGIDEDKKRLIEIAARRYIEGKKDDGIPPIAKSLGISPSNLHKILTKFSGTEYVDHFTHPATKEVIDVPLQIPPLLDEETIRKIREKTQINIDFVRGNRVWNYLLQGRIYCKRCGYKMAGHHKPSGRVYYIHSTFNKVCDFKKFVPGTELENILLVQLVKTFGDPDLTEKALNRAIPDEGRLLLVQEEEALKDNKRKLDAQKKNLVDAVADKTLSNDDVRDKNNKIDSQLRGIQIRLNTIGLELSSNPDPEEIKRVSIFAGKLISSAIKKNPRLIFRRTYEWKRKLIEQAFRGVSPDGKPLGVYIDIDEKTGGFTFEVKGLFENTINHLPLSDHEILSTFNFDPEFQDANKLIKQVRSNIGSQSA
jgi:site-specific DNA recombinase